MNALWFEASPSNERYAIKALTADEAGDVEDEISARKTLCFESTLQEQLFTYEWLR